MSSKNFPQGEERAEARVTPPCYCVKAAGAVVNQTNRVGHAHETFREVGALPAELWRVGPGGEARLLDVRLQAGLPSPAVREAFRRDAAKAARGARR